LGPFGFGFGILQNSNRDSHRRLPRTGGNERNKTKGADSDVNRTSEKRTRGDGLELEQWENESGEGVMRGRENEP